MSCDNNHHHHHGSEPCAHHHHHGHDHDHTHDDEMSMTEKLNTLLSHWVEHNDSHRDNFATWAARAKDEGLSEVAALLEEAGNLSDQVTAKLREAHKSL